jgi:CelD/BcsL family acetyltransferase involved in cellulose biosynthesis
MELTTATATAVQRKSGMRDNERRLAKLGTVEMQVIKPAEDQVCALETLFQQHRARWHSPERTSQFNDPATCEFYRRLCRSRALAPLLHFSVLKAGDHVLACHFGFVTNDSFIYYKPTYDPTVKGSGQVLMSRLMSEALSLGLKEFDFTRGSENYKTGLATGVRYNHEAKIFFTRTAWLRHQGSEWLRSRVPRDADGLALTTKFARRVRMLMGGH